MHRQNLKKILFFSTKQLFLELADKIKFFFRNQILFFSYFPEITVGGFVNQLIKKFWPNACIFTGDYKVTVFYCGQKVKGSPFVSNAFDASKVVVSKMPAGGMVGRPVTFDSEYYYCHLGLIARKSFFVVCSR